MKFPDTVSSSPALYVRRHNVSQSSAAAKKKYADFKSFRTAIERHTPDNRADLLPAFRKANNHTEPEKALLKLRKEWVQLIREARGEPAWVPEGAEHDASLRQVAAGVWSGGVVGDCASILNHSELS